MPDFITEPYPVTVGGNLPAKFHGWRQTQPVIGEKCSRCLLCWIYCPDGAIQQTTDGLVVDLDYCKGCGICARECPIHAIEMVEVVPRPAGE